MMRPILFSAPMVRAILDGRKTQTRRIVKPQPTDFTTGPCPCAGTSALWPAVENRGLVARAVCPYGLPGDRLWVKETFCDVSRETSKKQFVYRADLSPAELAEWGETVCLPWKPSIFMPRSASRITLENTAVRMERLQDISEADAKLEGCCGVTSTHFGFPNYRHVWESINGPSLWDANPWVWVISFKRV